MKQAQTATPNEHRERKRQMNKAEQRTFARMVAEAFFAAQANRESGAQANKESGARD